MKTWGKVPRTELRTSYSPLILQAYLGKIEYNGGAHHNDGRKWSASILLACRLEAGAPTTALRRRRSDDGATMIALHYPARG